MTTPDRELLRELSSLRDLLEPQAERSAPRTPTPPAARPEPEPPALLDLARIFDEEGFDGGGFDTAPPAALLPPPRFTLQPADTCEAGRAEPCREQIIQALVDEHLPRLEAELREHLRGLDDDALRAWPQSAGDD